MKIVTLLYHDIVVEDYKESGFAEKDAFIYKFKLCDFKQHIKKIRYLNPLCKTVFDLSNVGDRETPLIFTFDDGGIGAYRYTVDVLEQHGFRGHFLITTDYIGDKRFVNREQIIELKNRGHIVGTHTATHPDIISRCSFKEIVNEWEKSCSVLSDMLKERIVVGSVPAGHYSKRVARAASMAGIKFLFTSEPVMHTHLVDSCLVLGRFTVKNTVRTDTVCNIVSVKTFPRLKQYLLWNIKKIMKNLSGKYYIMARKNILNIKKGK